MTAYKTELPAFYPDMNDWELFVDRLDHFFELNKVPTAKHQPILLTTINECTYKKLQDICHPDVPQDKSFDELIELLSRQYFITRPVFWERKKFYDAKQTADETAQKWAERLQKLAIDCRFGSRLEITLSDSFICGLHSKALLERMCAEKNDGTLTLQRALEIAISQEVKKK